jgi:DNA-directed RNA polymerase beta' subunit
MEKRKLKKNEIQDILDSLISNTNLPTSISTCLLENLKKEVKKQLKNVEIYPNLIPSLKEQIKQEYLSSLVQPGECVGVTVGQSIGEKQTQTNLNTFHKAGSSDKQPVVSTFSELINATTKPKVPSFHVFFKNNYPTLKELRNEIRFSIKELTIEKISKDISIHINKEREEWYDLFETIHEKKPEYFEHCISLKLDKNILYEYKITPEIICNNIKESFDEVFCIFSPIYYSQIDIFIDTREIDLPEEKYYFIDEDNKCEIYLEEVILPLFKEKVIAGIQGIQEIYFNRKDDIWYIETENSKKKEKKEKNSQKQSQVSSLQRFKLILSNPFVDFTKTISNNIWDIYYIFGIEAVREYMIQQFIGIMDGINLCHINLLVDRMIHSGSIFSITRYTMKKENNGVFCKTSFEETLDNFLEAGVYGEIEYAKGVSASIICGKKSNIGSNLSKLSVDIDKIIKYS